MHNDDHRYRNSPSKQHKIARHFKASCLFTPILMLSGCLLPTPYGGIVAVGPIDFLRANHERTQEINEYYRNKPYKEPNVEITMSSEEIFTSGENLGVIELKLLDNFLDELLDTAYFNKLTYEYINDKNHKVIIRGQLIFNKNKVSTVPVINYPKRDVRYKNYKLNKISFNLSGNMIILFNQKDIMPNCDLNEKYVFSYVDNKVKIPMAELHFMITDPINTGLMECNFKSN